jgi:ATP-binding cassette subfamily C protein PrsD
MAPIDLAIANWRGLVSARQSWGRLDRLLALMPEQEAQTRLLSPNQSFTVEAVGVVPPGFMI